MMIEVLCRMKLNSRKLTLALSLMAMLAMEASPSFGQIYRLPVADTSKANFFGAAVAIDQNRILIGSTGSDSCGANSGAAHPLRWLERGVLSFLRTQGATAVSDNELFDLLKIQLPEAPDAHHLIGDGSVPCVQHQNNEMLAGIVSHHAPNESGCIRWTSDCLSDPAPRASVPDHCLSNHDGATHFEPLSIGRS